MRRTMATLLLLAALAGCTGQEVRPRPTPGAPLGFSSWQDVQPAYRLGPGDKVAVRYLRTPEMDEDVVVQPDGQVTLKAGGPTPAIDLTLEEFRAAVATSSQRYLRDPAVSVGLLDATSARIYISGEVKGGGVFRVPGRMAPLEAVFLAGGFNENARRSEVVLIRRGPDNTPMLRTLDLAAALDGRLTGPDVPIYPGDILFVPRTTIAEINLWIELFIERVLPFERSFQYSLNRNQNSRF